MRATIISLFVTALFFSTPLFGQKILAELGEAKADNKALSHYYLYGVHQGKEIQGHTKGNVIRILKDKKKVVEEKVSFKTKDGKSYLNKVILKKDEIVTLSLISSNKSEGIYLQTLSYDDLSQITKPIKISSLDEVAKNSIPSVFRTGVASMKVYYDEKTENISIVVTAEPNGDGAKRFVEIINLDSKYNVIGKPYVFYAQNTENKVAVSELKIYENGTVAAVIQERDDKFITGYTLTYMLPTDIEPHEVEVNPARNQIGGIKLSDNTLEDNFTFSILSFDSKAKSNAVLTVYKYDTKKESIESENYSSDELNSLGQQFEFSKYKIEESYFLKNGSNIITLSISYETRNYRSDGSLDIDYYEKGYAVIKLDEKQKIAWVSEVKRNAATGSYPAALEYLSYFTNDGVMEIVFNTNENQFKNGSYDTDVKKSDIALNLKDNENFIPTKATIDLQDGGVSIKEMKFENKKLRALSLDEVVKGDEPGIYTLKVLLDKTPTLVKLDFK